MKKRTRIIFGVVLTIVIVGVLFLWQKNTNKGPIYETLKIKPSAITLDIAFTGRVQSHNSAQLGFETSGIATKVLVKTGDTVQKGQQLAVLDNSLQQLALYGAEATQATQQTATQLAVASATTALQKTKDENSKTISALRQNVIDAKKAVTQNEAIWVKAKDENNNETSSTTETKRLAVITAQGIYNSAQQALTTGRATAEKSESTAQSALVTAQAQDTATRQAALNTPGKSFLETQTQSARVQLAKKILIAPFDGVITNTSMVSSELVIGGQSIMTIETINDLEVLSQVSEKQVAKLAVGMNASATFDALGLQHRTSATITRIDPTGTPVDGLPKYNVYLSLQSRPPALRPDFTANIIVHAAHKENVLTIPRSAIVIKNDSQFVYTQTGSSYAKTTITTGLEGSDGNVEVTSGLTTGDIIISRPNELPASITDPTN